VRTEGQFRVSAKSEEMVEGDMRTTHVLALCQVGGKIDEVMEIQVPESFAQQVNVGQRIRFVMETVE